jgi:cardiolipin synthase
MEVLRGVQQRPKPLSTRGSVDEPPITAPQFERALELLTGTHIDPGNRVAPLLNGNGTYPMLWRDLVSARSTITMQMYYAKPGRVSDTVAAILCDRARSRVRVLLLLDAFGSEAVGRSWQERLRGCGVDVALLRELQWHTIHSATNRSHVRAVVVDGRIGYTGGFGLADYWLGDGHHADQWRETNVRFEGPAVAGLQAAFATAWAEATGELLSSSLFFATDDPTLERTGGAGLRAGLLYTAPTIGNTTAERFLALAIRSARSRLYIANPYFVPNESIRRLLKDAADRGVDVRILTVSGNTDVKTPWLAGRYRYEELVAHGIRVYEYLPAMMHAKTIVIDGYWATIGSMNLDSHSLAFNNESNLVVLDSAFGARMESIFCDDLQDARAMTPSVLAARPWWERMLERGAVVLSRIL